VAQDNNGRFVVANVGNRKAERVRVIAFPEASRSTTIGGWESPGNDFSAEVPFIDAGKSITVGRTDFTNGFGAILPDIDSISVLLINAKVDEKREGRLFSNDSGTWKPEPADTEFYAAHKPLFPVEKPWKQAIKVEIRFTSDESPVDNPSGIVVMNEENADIEELRLTLCPPGFGGNARVKPELFAASAGSLPKGDFTVIELADMKNHWGDAPPGPRWRDCGAETIMITGKVGGVLKGGGVRGPDKP